jgi:preprotein translocase subunit SecA
MKITPFREQLIAALALCEGKLIEMNTGEGKTLVAVFAAVYYALARKGVHVVTFNDYLAKRDMQWMGPVYEFVAMTAGFIQEGMTPDERRVAYQYDITYCTAREAAFDYLRDCLCNALNDRVHRDLQTTIIDEADSLLIDEARVPLVIAGEDTSEFDNIPP